MNNIANNLKYLMKQKEVTISELVTILKISPEQISRIKNGKLENTALNTVIKISKHFDVPFETLALGTLN
jgi:DNA-binding Xre family transcriptional regulator